MSVIDTYLNKLEPSQRAALERVRGIVKQAVPDAEEVLSYGMPGFRYHGHALIWFAAFKKHLSIFPTAGPVALLEDKLGAFKHAKGTIQFTVDAPLPEALIQELVIARMASIINS